MSSEAGRLIAKIRQSPDGMTRQEILSWLKVETPWAGFPDVDKLVKELGPVLEESEGRLRFAGDEPKEVSERQEERPWRRFVAFDLETIVRPVVQAPYKEQRVFQIGAARFGSDSGWTTTPAEFSAFAELENTEDEALIYSPGVRARYEEMKRPLAEVLQDFCRFCSGADAVVAYNGVSHDFPLIEKELERCELPPLLKAPTSPRAVDALYLAHALWPIPPRQHSLYPLLQRLEVDAEEMQWHDALDDSKMVIKLLRFGADEFLPAFGQETLDLLAAVGSRSDAWRLMLSLLELSPTPRVHTHAEVARLIEANLAQKPTKRPLRPETSPTSSEGSSEDSPEVEAPQVVEFEIPESLLEGGRVSLAKLVAAVKGAGAEPRESQGAMVSHLRSWLQEGKAALVEAPTGTGKSYALLTVALDWLAANRENKVIISTFTKQLQSQLAADIEALTESAMPDLAAVADMVKGAANRLSLRALAVALADLSSPEDRRRRRRQDFSSDQRYRDLVVYLLLRFVAEGKPTEEWETRSVDSVDVPAFFRDYCPQRLALYLASLSQGENQDYASDRGGVGRYTMSVREALESRRLIIANHALLLAHLDDLGSIGKHTLLFVDEAHELENAATSAMTPEVDSRAIAELSRQAGEWARDQREGEGMDQLLEAVEKFERYIEDGRLEKAAMLAFDTAERDPLARDALRTVTVASPLQGDAFVRPMEHLAAELRLCLRYVGMLRASLRRVDEGLLFTEPFEADRFRSLLSRTMDIDRALSAVVADTDAVLAPSQGLPPEGVEQAIAAEKDVTLTLPEGQEQISAGGGTGDEAGSEVESGEQLTPIAEQEEIEIVVDEDDLEPEGPAPSLVRPNRLVFAEELREATEAGPEWYRFKLSSAPIELAREQDWQAFKKSFARSYYVSATLRVADDWSFIRRRLDLPEKEVLAIALDSPFDAMRQAELICFEDFPSWAEHGEAAMHMVAHQLAGYADSLIDAEGQNGAMVLTTSRASAAGIFDWLARLRVERDQHYPLISAGLEGNQRAVETFKRVGGALVGTRGLWQGVDISDAARLRLVWINKLPFAPFADPVIEARIALETEYAEMRGEEDPEGYASEHYYLPLAALALRQAVGRLIRSQDHSGIIIISDRKLAGPSRLRRLYRKVFLGSLDSGLMREDDETGEEWLGNVCTMQEGWRRAFTFFERQGLLSPEEADRLCDQEHLRRFTELPETLAILEQELSPEEVVAHSEAGTLPDELVARGRTIAGYLKSAPGPITLKDKQEEAIRAIAEGKDVLGVLPTGYGKSYVFQLPALAMPGVTVVVSPLVSLMTDQALELNRTIGGRVRALVAPMRESNSRTGKSEVEQELKGLATHGIKMIYLSPERLCQRHFQEWIRIGVEKGIVNRIAIDEAHTFVQWGDDFRPSLKRAEEFLRYLKNVRSDLQLIALTATANSSVREGLRRSLFGLSPRQTRADFAFVLANPLRTELAVYRRSFSKAGSTSVAGLVERVVDSLDGHAIFYCLTVRQTRDLYAHLSDYLQGHGVELLMYHGRLTDAEKARTASRFTQAPKKDEDGYRRMIVVATSAFGLGIDRADIRTVFCVSPPPDLASLYQQLGRAGRDRAATPGQPGPYTAALAISYPRAQKTINFMTRQQDPSDLLERIVGRLLQQASVFSSRSLALDLIDEDLKAKKVTPEEAAKSETADRYQTRILRVLAELSARGLVADLGDFPKTLLIRHGDYEPEEGYKDLLAALWEAIPADRRVETVDLFAQLGPRFRGEIEDAGALWHTLLELHTLGYLDVSQRYNKEQLTGIEVRSKTIPSDLFKGLRQGQTRTALEVATMRGWFASAGVCCNEDFRRYFEAQELPDGICETDDCRCSSCWNKAGLSGAVEPALYQAFRSDNLKPASATVSGRRRSEEQLDKLVCQLLWHNQSGLVESIIWRVLRGDDSYFSRAEGKLKPLWPKLLLSRAHGRKPALRKGELSDSLKRLVANGEVTRVNNFRYRLTRYVQQEADRPQSRPQAKVPASAPPTGSVS